MKIKKEGVDLKKRYLATLLIILSVISVFIGASEVTLSAILNGDSHQLYILFLCLLQPFVPYNSYLYQKVQQKHMFLFFVQNIYLLSSIFSPMLKLRSYITSQFTNVIILRLLYSLHGQFFPKLYLVLSKL